MSAAIPLHQLSPLSSLSRNTHTHSNHTSHPFNYLTSFCTPHFSSQPPLSAIGIFLVGASDYAFASCLLSNAAEATKRPRFLGRHGSPMDVANSKMEASVPYDRSAQDGDRFPRGSLLTEWSRSRRVNVYRGGAEGLSAVKREEVRQVTDGFFSESQFGRAP